MMNIWFRWYFGYWAHVDMRRLKLRRGQIHFYNKNNGEVVTCNLEDSVQFDIRVNCDIKYTRSNVKLDYTKGVVFAVRHKGDEYDLCIPMEEVGLMKLNKKEYVLNDETNILVRRRYCFCGSGLNFWNPNCDDHNFYLSKDKKHINFEVYIETKQTEKGKYIEEMSRTIREECSVIIDTYDMGKILEKFKIEKL